MSRGYRVTWETASRTVRASDKLEIPVSLLEIMPAGEMLDLLRGELEADGWKRQRDGAMTIEVSEGATARLSPDGKTITLTLAGEKMVQGGGRSAEAAGAKAEEAAVGASKALEEKIGKALARLEPGVRERLQGAVQRTYVQALRRKAATLGEIESITTGTDADGTEEIVIKVRA
jgi:hypothetical protein